MAYVQKPGTGALWVNDRKTEDKHPDRTGTLVMPDGSEYFIDGWLKETKAGADGKTKKFLSLSVKRKNKQPGQEPAQSAQRPQPQQASPARRPGLPPPPQDPVDTTMDPTLPDIPF